MRFTTTSELPMAREHANKNSSDPVPNPSQDLDPEARLLEKEA